MFCCFVFFFVKQKTAYEMRISDWSSDVCSSDLHDLARHGPVDVGEGDELEHQRFGRPGEARQRRRHHEDRQLIAIHPVAQRDRARLVVADRLRSEEHTSELQSLMRISYAVFCLKKKKHHARTQRHTSELQTLKNH